MAEVNNQVSWKASLGERLQSSNYPATRDQLIAAAESTGADEAEMQMLRSIPDETYQNWDEVSNAIGEPV